MGKLIKIATLSGKIRLLSGLMIGGSNAEIRIGGVDHEVVKHPVTEEPYIPGSSLKGKVRSLLEAKYGRYGRGGNPSTDGEPCQCGKKDCVVCRLFGTHKNPKSPVAPPRLIFRDCGLSEGSKEWIKGQPLEKRSYYEIKAENSIDRLSGTASNPRTMERVSADMCFDFAVVLQIFEEDEKDYKDLKSIVECGIHMLEKSYLGGRGSAGNGQIAFEDLEWSEDPI